MSMQPPHDNPQQGQQPYGPPQTTPYGQPYYAAPGGMPPAPKKGSALPWILGGVGAAVFVVIAVVVVLFLVQLAKPGTVSPDAQGQDAQGSTTQETAQETTLSATTAATFSYPAGWVETSKNVTSIAGDGITPAERLVLVDGSKDTSVLAVYTSWSKPQGEVTTEKIHEAVGVGFQGQLDASPEKLIDMRSTSGFGCVDTFAYTDEPVIVDRDGLYGYSYGYTCDSYQGPIQGEYLVAYDTTGVAHRLTVEALAAQWAANASSLQAIIPSLIPVG
ncbi:hypothetical protein [Arthrobacter sp. GMC3]|uniref:hypothetical protein n=1 Tax=Arthrobacter sp. GMC3 TaxID=2058894 RepID=UPI000CE2CCD2|nr:hypothetical protein [Arthrobacter sp. GMC3]